MIAIFRPWNAWPERPTPIYMRRSPSTFRQGWSDTMARLTYELERIDAKDVVVQLDVDESAIRNDGWPRADVRPRSPGVIVSFDLPKVGRVRYAVDSHDVWHHNLRALALGLEALRAVDRYGISRRGEQYAGWKGLPSSTTPAMSTEQAAAWLAGLSGITSRAILRTMTSTREALRIAAARTHPDAGGDAGDFARVQEAKRVLTAHHGGSL